jgi:hypothetical protein
LVVFDIGSIGSISPRQVEYYMKLPYTMTVQYQAEQGGYYVAGFLELPDLTMTGFYPGRGYPGAAGRSS